MIDIDKSIKIIEQNNPLFPKGLLNLFDCPTRLYALGNELLLNNISVAIVGTRACSDYGKFLAKKFSSEISKYNTTIISGMADGIDESAHAGTYDCGSTIAVVAGGFNNILKGSKLKTAEEIIQHNGLIISEYHPDYIVAKGMFLHRNRLIAAIAAATIVIEAPIASGAMNTASHAIQLGRPLYVIPWNLNYFKGEGCNSLFLQGAKPLIDIKQVVIDLNIVPNQTEIDLKATYNHQSIPDEYLKYYSFIKENSPCLLESILETFKGDFVGNIISILTIMELNNYIKLSDNGYYIT